MKELIYLVAGLGIGAGVTYILTKSYYEKQIDFEVDETRAAYEAKIDEITTKLTAASMTDYGELGNPPTIKSVTLHGSEATKPDEVDQNVDYNKIIEDLNYGKGFDDCSEEEETDIPQSKVKPDKHSTIKVISEDEFLADEGYEKEIISYFEDGDDFANTEDEIIDDFTSYIGGLDHVRNADIYDGDMVFIRNEITHTDYQIVKHEESYDEYMEGSY